MHASLQLAAGFFGEEILLNQIDRDQCRQFRDLLNEIPANMRKHLPTEGVPLAKIVKEGRRRKLPTLKRNTQDTYVRAFKMLLDWARDEQLIALNPMNGLKPLGEQTPPKEARDPFSIEQLSMIFRGALYARPFDAEKDERSPSRFWIPLLGLYTGMRLNEICQLHVEDVTQTSAGIWYISVNADNGKRLKNVYSKRFVPLHPELERLGFLKFVKAQSAPGNRRLFDEIRASSHGYLSDQISKWFNRTYLPSVNAKSEKIAFHSFRHGFKDALRRAGTATEIDDAICGWSTIRGVSLRYGNGYSADTLAPYMRKIRFDSLDLAHLHVPGEAACPKQPRKLRKAA